MSGTCDPRWSFWFSIQVLCAANSEAHKSLQCLCVWMRLLQMHHLDVLNGPWVEEPLSSSSSLLLKPIEMRPVGWHALTKPDCGVWPWQALRSSIRAWKLIREHHSLYSTVFRKGMHLLSLMKAWWKHKASSLGCFSARPSAQLSDFRYQSGRTMSV